MREQGRLAAIVSADVIGYFRLMSRDESGTLARLQEQRSDQFEPTLARHGGLSLLKNPSSRGIGLLMKTAADEIRLSNRPLLSSNTDAGHMF